MDDKLETAHSNGNKKLRDSFPITCATCGMVIGHSEPYRIVGMQAGAGKTLAANVYQHRGCAPKEA